MSISAPNGTPYGIYDGTLAVTFQGQNYHFPLLMEATSREAHKNLIVNGDFERGSAHWFFDKKNMTFVKEGVNGTMALKSVGNGHAGNCRVSKGSARRKIRALFTMFGVTGDKAVVMIKI